MKKAENLELIRKLASSRIDTTLLRSSKNLGVKEPKRNVLSSASRAQKPDFGGQKKDILLPENQSSDDSLASSDSELYSKSSKLLELPKPPLNFALGSGLKRSLATDENGNLIIKKRRRLGNLEKPTRERFESPWEGFETTSDSQNSLSDSRSCEVQSRFDKEIDEKSEDLSKTNDNTDEKLESDDHVDAKVHGEERSSAFKAWASQQVYEALGFKPRKEVSDVADKIDTNFHEKIQPREPENDPLPPELEVKNPNSLRTAFSVEVKRSLEIQEARLKLPIVADEQKIMEAIYNNPSIVIWGATGSGKTTQVPQFLYEAGFGNPQSATPGMIGVTGPRRVAAVSMAKRVSDELGDVPEKVSYQIRFESSVGKETAIKFMTDGILVREIANDFALSKYSVIIIDEAHERSINTDILIGMISRIVDLRENMSKENKGFKPLKFIIMSATLRIADFMDNPNLFRHGRPPLIQIEGRQHLVSIHFARKTRRDYVEEIFHKVCKGHKQLPSGGMLVFLTGQNEIMSLAKRLKATFKNSQSIQTVRYKVRLATTEVPLETEDLDLEEGDSYVNEGASDEDGEFEEGDEQAFNIGGDLPASLDVHVLPLYSQMQTKDQLAVFEPPPKNARLIVLATNVAETSLTIPGIRYVFDCGRVKDKKYDQVTAVQRFEIGWISKASAEQRAGRAGRTGPGHCYRLYSSAVYERDFVEHAEPEISRMPVEGVVLQLKSMGLQQVINFPFPTPPNRQALAKAENLLAYLGAVSSNGVITPSGRELSIYPLSPRLSKMLIIGHQHDCMPYTIAMVAALAVQSILIPENQLDLSPSFPGMEKAYSNAESLADVVKEEQRKRYNRAQHLFSKYSSTSDALKTLAAVCAYEYAAEPASFCTEMFLSHKSLKEASSLRRQLSNIVNSNHPTLVPKYSARLPPPSQIQIRALQQILAAAFIDQIAVRADLSPSPPDQLRKPSRTIDVPYIPLFPAHVGKAQELTEVAVFIHPSSILNHISPKELPKYLVYKHLQRGTPTTISDCQNPKTRMHALAAISGKQIIALAQGTPLIRYGKPVGKCVEDEGKRECWVVPELIGERGREGWPLPAVKVVQRKDAKDGWVVDTVIGS